MKSHLNNNVGQSVPNIINLVFERMRILSQLEKRLHKLVLLLTVNIYNYLFARSILFADNIITEQDCLLI